MPDYGDIVEGLSDPNGVNPKPRPCVVVASGEAIAAGGPIPVVAISTLLPGPVPPDVVAIQYHPRGHPKTGLKTRSAAFARRLVEVEPAQVARKIGHVPPRELLSVGQGPRPPLSDRGRRREAGGLIACRSDRSRT